MRPYISNPKDTAKQSVRKFGNFCKILVNYLSDSAVPPWIALFCADGSSVGQ